MLWLRKIPVLRQMNAVECGAACLAMILSYYSRKTSVSEVRDFCGIERDGVSALALVKAAQEYGLEVKALSLQDSNLQGITLPAIVHWKFQHFLVVERWSTRKVVVIDPALGRRSLSPEEFDAAFTGVVIMLKPGKHFVRRSRAADKKLRTYVSGYLKYASQILLQVIAVSLLIQIFSLGIPFLTQMLVDEIIPLRKYDSMTLLGLGMIVFLLMNTIAMILRSYLLLYLQAHAGLSMTLDFFRHLLSLPLRFFQRRSNGDMLTRFGSDAAVRELLSSQLITTSLDSVLVLLSFIILFWQSPTFTLLVFGVGLLQILLMLMTHRALRSAAEQELDAQSKAQGYAVEALTGMATLKSIGAEKNTLEQWSKLLFEQVKAAMQRDYLSAHIEITLTVLRICTPFLLLWYGAFQVLSGQLSIGTMLALNALAINFLTPLSSLSNSGQTFQLLRSHLERIADVLDAESEQIQPVQPAPRLQGNITLKQVSFRYAPHSPLVLKEINVHIQAGQKVAIVGRTGSGKSTLGKLLLGLYLPTLGEILYDDNPLGSMQFPSVRAQFGTVIQESHIFSGSVRENIAFHRSGINMEHIMKASQLAALHDDILSMPMHYETFVAEQGSALSGGQRQRLALARALVHNPSILLLDEATSHLDVITEQTIQRNLDALTCTRIIIAHRLSTIQDADLILLLEQGRIVEQGTHQDLLQKNGYYRRLVRQQLVLDDITEILPVVKYTRKPDAGNPVRPSSNGTSQSRDLEQIGADINSSGEEIPSENVRLLP